MPMPAGDGVCETMFVVCSVRALSPRLPVIVPFCGFVVVVVVRSVRTLARMYIGCPPSSSGSARRKDDDGAGISLLRSIGLEAGSSNSRMN